MPTATLVFPLLEIELWCVSQMGQAHLGASITLSPPFVQSLVTGLVFELALPGGKNGIGTLGAGRPEPKGGLWACFEPKPTSQRHHLLRSAP